MLTSFNQIGFPASNRAMWVQFLPPAPWLRGRRRRAATLSRWRKRVQVSSGLSMRPWSNWIGHLPSKQGDAGSNPAGRDHIPA